MIEAVILCQYTARLCEIELDHTGMNFNDEMTGLLTRKQKYHMS